MKAFLLAAGEGTRLRPITDQVPKCLVPIRGVPMLQIWMEICRSTGIDEVMINLHSHAEIVRTWLEKNGNGNRIRLVEESTLLGSAGTVLANRDWLASDSCFWILYADVLTNANLKQMAKLHLARQPAATLGLYQVPDPSRCGVVSFDEQMIVREFVEKPARPTSRWAFSGVMIGTPKLLNQIPSRYPADLGFDVLPRLVGDTLAYPISEYLIDIGTLENYESAQVNWPGLAA
jgi:mannose-1-phosphate guanylyltransferase